MSRVNAAVIFEQLQRLMNEGENLAEYYVDECDNFGGQAIILPIEVTATDYDVDMDEERYAFPYMDDCEYQELHNGKD